jgi:hypothetical protein
VLLLPLAPPPPALQQHSQLPLAPPPPALPLIFVPYIEYTLCAMYGLFLSDTEAGQEYYCFLEGFQTYKG